MKKHRNTEAVKDLSITTLLRLKKLGLTHQQIEDRDGKVLILKGGKRVCEFINCSYLGLDQDPRVMNAYRGFPKSLGVNFCAARTRASFSMQTVLEKRLSEVYQKPCVSFSSTSNAHVSVMPLLVLNGFFEDNYMNTIFVFDRFSHSSMQFLKPILEVESSVETILHCDYLSLESILRRNPRSRVVYVADTIYSMGGSLNVSRLSGLSEIYKNLYLYLDDAHGTAIFGKDGTGFVWDHLSQQVRKRTVLAFCLSKGFGTNGGGVVLPNENAEFILRSFGQTYAFSGTLELSSISASLTSLDIQMTDEIKILREKLWENAKIFDDIMNIGASPNTPIRMVQVRDEAEAVRIGSELLSEGFLVSVAVFPVVPKMNPQIRLCITAVHTGAEIKNIATLLREKIK